MLRLAFSIAIPACLLAGAATAQSTQPHWSTYFGRAGTDVAWVVKRGPGSLVTIAGHTESNGLATPGAYQTSIAGPSGDVDGFVARFDASLPPAQQLLWCTYFGGAALELVFDAEVDAQGNVIVAGLTLSSNLPVVNGFQVTRKGPSDGFVARFDAQGAVLLWSSYLGGDGDDRINDLESSANGSVTVAGVTEGAGLLMTAGTVGPAYSGGTDAFAARIDPSLVPASQLSWASYLGGPLNEGTSFATWMGSGGWNNSWEGDLDNVSLVVEPSGPVAVVTPSQSTTATTTPGCLQPVHGGVNNVYFVRLNANATSFLYATFFGGSRNGPRAIALHPAGGFVIAGQGIATNMPTTPGCFQPINQQGWYGNPSDGFVCWIDPGQPLGQHLRYSTWFGGSGGEDSVLCLAVESSGIVTIGGYVAGGGNVPVTPGCSQPTLNPAELGGVVARLAMNGQGANDLHYSTYLGNNWTYLTGLTLDEVGDVLITGASDSASYPTVNAHQPALGGARDAVITHLPLLPGGTSRHDLAFATPACSNRLYSGTLGAPLAGNLAFALTATNAPPQGYGFVVFGFGSLAGGPLPVLNITLLVSPDILGGIVPSDALGFASHALPVPASTAPGFQLHCQWAFLTNPACPGSGLLGASERLVFTTF